MNPTLTRDATTIRATYLELADIIGKRDSRKIQHNTRLRREDSDLVIRYHATDVLRYHGDDTVTIDTGGWHSVTSATRYQNWLPLYWSVANHNGAWNVYGPGDEVTMTYGNMARNGYYTRTYRPAVAHFRIWDGMTITDQPRPRVLNFRDAPDFERRDREALRIESDIARYVKLYSDERISELLPRDAESISLAGDCWYCLFIDTDKETNNGHLRGHLQDGYTMVSLIRNAYDARGFQPGALLLWARIEPAHVRKTVKLFLTSRLVPNGIPATDKRESVNV